MEEFYEALRGQGKDARQIEIIRTVFEKEEFGVGELDQLTDEKLKEYGLKQGGLRVAVLKVIGK